MNLGALPKEVLCIIFSYSSMSDLNVVRRVSKTFNMYSQANLVWGRHLPLIERWDEYDQFKVESVGTNSAKVRQADLVRSRDYDTTVRLFYLSVCKRSFTFQQKMKKMKEFLYKYHYQNRDTGQTPLCYGPACAWIYCLLPCIALFLSFLFSCLYFLSISGFSWMLPSSFQHLLISSFLVTVSLCILLSFLLLSSFLFGLFFCFSIKVYYFGFLKAYYKPSSSIYGMDPKLNAKKEEEIKQWDSRNSDTSILNKNKNPWEYHEFRPHLQFILSFLTILYAVASVPLVFVGMAVQRLIPQVGGLGFLPLYCYFVFYFVVSVLKYLVFVKINKAQISKFRETEGHEKDTFRDKYNHKLIRGFKNDFGISIWCNLFLFVVCIQCFTYTLLIGILGNNYLIWWCVFLSLSPFFLFCMSLVPVVLSTLSLLGICTFIVPPRFQILCCTLGLLYKYELMVKTCWGLLLFPSILAGVLAIPFLSLLLIGFSGIFYYSPFFAWIPVGICLCLSTCLAPVVFVIFDFNIKESVFNSVKQSLLRNKSIQ